MGKKRGPPSQETRLKISLAKRGKPSPLKGRPISKTHRKHMMEARKNHPPMLGKHHTLESRIKIKESNLEHFRTHPRGPLSPETRLKISQINKEYFRTHPRERMGPKPKKTRRKISEGMKRFFIENPEERQKKSDRMRQYQLTKKENHRRETCLQRIKKNHGGKNA